jgi:hypothetical protein
LEKSPLKSETRPRIVTWLALGALIFSILFIVRFYLSYHLPNLPITIPRWYLSLTGFVWGLAGLVLSYGLFQIYPWALRMLTWGSLSFSGWYWLDRLFFASSEYSQLNWIASLILTFIALGLILGIQRRLDVQAAFKENEK